VSLLTRCKLATRSGIISSLMCGRYRLSRRKQLIEDHFDSASGEEDWIPRYNVAPTQLVSNHPPESQGTRP
jgi:SOS response associated peptidase (SRAP)